MRLENITKVYTGETGTVKVFDRFTLELPDKGVIWLMGASGCGKTTLLRIIAGLEDCEGTVTGRPTEVSAVFQENRLFEQLSAEGNCILAMGKVSRGNISREKVREMLLSVGIASEDISRPVSEFSGGMKRRVAIVRALCHAQQKSCRAVLMDEPFTGIDGDSRILTGRLISETLGGRLFIGVTHREEDTELVKGEKIIIKS